MEWLSWITNNLEVVGLILSNIVALFIKSPLHKE